MTKKIKVSVFEGLREGLQDAIAYEKGQTINLRVQEIPAPPKPVSPKEIRRIRETLNATQEVFASYLNVSANAVRSWEQGTRRPQQAALKLLAIAKKNPLALLTA
jgi:putative transcriptional regulator